MITTQQRANSSSPSSPILEKIDAVFTTALPSMVRETQEQIRRAAQLATTTIADTSLASLTGATFPVLPIAREVVSDLAFEAISSQVDSATNPWGNLSSALTIPRTENTSFRDAIKREIHDRVADAARNEVTNAGGKPLDSDRPETQALLPATDPRTRTQPTLKDLGLGSKPDESRRRREEATQSNHNSLRARALLPPRLTLY